MSLSLYHQKRSFSETPEPEGKEKSSKGMLRFVVQKHDASQLHYDFRLEMDGVLKSWAVPKGPSLKPADKRLAMPVEDHPYDYRNFEGVIPEGNYGAGTVMVWDEGTYEPEKGEGMSKKKQEQLLLQQYEEGNLIINLHGNKLKGLFALFRMKGDEKPWLLVKKKDEYASGEDVTAQDKSVKSGKTLLQIATEKGAVLNHPENKQSVKASSVKKIKKAEPKTAGKKVNPGAYKNKKLEPEQLGTADEKAADIKLNGHLVQVTNLKKLYWTKEGFTKGDMLYYYHRIAPYILPYMKDRPQSLHRHPNGINGKHFFQKDMTGKLPDWIPTHEDYSESTDETIQYMICNNEASLLYMANLGCIEMHPWHSRHQKPDLPDYCLVDLDPDKNNSFEQVIETAHVVKSLLDELKADCYCKTSGSTGLHIYVPLGAKYTYDESKQFAELLVGLVHQEMPGITSLERNPAKRKGKIYLDFLQNSQAQTAAAPYSLRPKPGVPVSTPVDWSEVKKGLTPTTHNATNIFDRLKTEGDLFKPILGKGVDLKKILNRLLV
ncbi:non-homologous end-joining DNA ligase [Chitinophagaceae bacterium LB-8]|uniref:Non-homologous end-joining DNA ligase n=1 Tax=Paraflavisolibacter caeni TaxID=2982496 RepID=A0A9X2XUX7_9BACT|nr:non-homologous end-joining DNA ligase [Paraflavisolibacter caeni]MCU7549551.1 non-homologous end-joining DNA ligase [Paraflavisolibacter caeni]